MSAQALKSRRDIELVKLQDRRLLRELAYVDGQWTAPSGGKIIEVRNPANGEILAWVAALDVDQVSTAIEAANRAFARWRETLPQKRADVLRQWHRLILEAKQDLALLMTLEQGKPLAEALGEIDYAASFIEWYAEEGKRLNVETITSHLPDVEMIVRREPLGVVGVVTPWNFPAAMLTRKAAAALAAGCTVVAHPSCETPLSALALAELGERAGLPRGVFNVVTGNPPDIVGRLSDDARVRCISFTGSTHVGKLIAARCAGTVKRQIMELGGHAPLLVFDDANVEHAVSIAVAAKFATSGQDCLGTGDKLLH